MSERNKALDIIKFIAMLAIIALHSVGSCASTGFTPIIANIMYNMGIIGMPLFFMASGYMLLGKKNLTYSYCIRKIESIFKFCASIAFIYMLVRIITGNVPSWHYTLDTFPGCFMQRGPLMQFWFLGSLIIIYLVLIPLNELYRSSYFKYFLIFLALLCMAVYSFNFVSVKNGQALFEIRIPQTLRLYSHLFYFMLGGALKATKQNNNSTVLSSPLFAACSFTLLLLSIFLLNPLLGNKYCEYSYTNPLCMLTVTSLFCAINAKNWTINLHGVEKLFLPVYTIHLFIISMTMQCYGVLPWRMPFHYIIVASLSICCAAMIMRIPVIKNIFKI